MKGHTCRQEGWLVKDSAVENVNGRLLLPTNDIGKHSGSFVTCPRDRYVIMIAKARMAPQ